jgi:tubulin polyglutamylase TTLL6/13
MTERPEKGMEEHSEDEGKVEEQECDTDSEQMAKKIGASGLSQQKSELKGKEDINGANMKSKKKMVMNIGDTRYPVMKYVAKKLLGWKVCKDIENKNFDLFWTDGAVQAEELSKLQVYQKVNHFPGILYLS